ncbi:hypothetical protein GLOTRDRAFT_92447 [Gloeophyllum trabeum ATCC 11539]|uniref:Eukaryotic translation initiation factor 3 subunit C n=1 Tax=Gloeophyllum trabeum (strain ATCC 11539 / FP-39264 / Madison 617) TaxID=670483 RepID=S7RRZ6_GLOTA|nr:uncharacterized protein GLOTRDRAFT_92447 [Gloeophyllum trabeum ATCC 11539]EPQ57410.1 hypothetical protein GLOTRDRAFT_92447 [Gloeophyllum trabeum ATCC 11539]
MSTPGKPRFSAIPTPGRTPGIPAPGRLRSTSGASQNVPPSADDFASRAFVDAMKAHDPTQQRSARTSDVSVASLSPQSAVPGIESGRRSVNSRPASVASSSSATGTAAPQVQRPRTPSASSRPRSRQSDLPSHSNNASRANKSFTVGDNVRIESLGYEGTLKYLGEIDGKPGTWAGVELSGGFAGKGKNDGTVNGKRYFSCPPQCGVFVAATKLSLPTVGPGAVSRPSSVASVRNGRITPSVTGRITPSFGSSVSGRVTPSASTGRITPSNSGRVTPSSSFGQRTPGLPKPRTIARAGATPAAMPTKSGIARENEKSLLAENKITPGSRASKYLGMTAEHLNTRSPPSTSPTRTSMGSFGLQRGPGPPSPTRRSAGNLGSPPVANLGSPSRTSSSPFATPKAKGRLSNPGPGIPTSPSKGRTSLSTPRARVPSNIAMPPPASPSRRSGSSRSVSLNDELPANLDEEHFTDPGLRPISSLEMNGKLLQDKIANLLSGRSTPQLSTSTRPDSSASGGASYAADQLATIERLQSRLDALEHENKTLIAATERQSSERITALQAESAKATARISALESQVKASERTLTERDSKIDALERNVKQVNTALEKARSDAENKIKDLQSNLEDKESLISELKDAITAKEGAQDEKDAVLKAKDTEIALLENRIQKLSTDLENERKELGAQVEELRQAGQETIALYEERLSAADFKRYELEDLVASLQEQLKAHAHGSSADPTSPHASTAAQIDNEALRDQVQYLQQKVASLEDLLEDARAMTEKEDVVVREKIQRYKEKEDAMRKQLEESRVELEKVTQAESSARTRIQEIEEAFRESTVALENAQAEIEILRTEVSNLEGLTASMKAGESGEKLADIAERTARDRARMNEEITRLKAELDEARRAQREMDGEFGSPSTVGSLSDMQATIKQLESEKREMEDILRSSRELLAAEQKSAADMRQALEDQEGELEALKKRLNRDVSVNNGLQDPAKSKHEIATARDEITGLKHIVQELQKENLVTNQRNKALAAENELLSSEIEKLRATLLREEQALDGEIAGSDETSAQKVRQELKMKYEMELEQLRKRHAEAEMKSARTIHDLNKEVSELETLVESKDELEREVERLREKVSRSSKKSSKGSSDGGDARVRFPPGRSSTGSTSSNALQLDKGEPVCEICERPGHDIFSCDLLSDDAASIRSSKSGMAGNTTGLYCEDCESHGHTAADCPHSLDELHQATVTRYFVYPFQWQNVRHRSAARTWKRWSLRSRHRRPDWARLTRRRCDVGQVTSLVRPTYTASVARLAAVSSTNIPVDMSYASVAAHNLPPNEPHPDPALLNTEPPTAGVADDTLKVNVVPSDFRAHPATVTSEKTVYTEPELPEAPGAPSKKDKAKKRLHQAEDEGLHLWEVTKQTVLQPGVAGGLIGIANVGLISAVGYLYYTRPGLRRDTKVITSTVAGALALLGLEGYGAQAYRKTPKGQEEERRAREEGAVVYRYLKEHILRPGVLGGLVGLLNVGILGTVGYFGYTNWDRPQWDRRIVSSVSVGLLALWGGEGQAGDSDSDSESSSEEELMSSGDEDAAPKPTATGSKPAMSRFLRTAGSDSSDADSDESDEDEEEMSDEEEGQAQRRSRFLRTESDSEEEDEDDVRRVVKSAKDKRYEEMEATGKIMDNALKINDWVAISSEFDKLARMVQRSQNVSEPVPPFFIRTLINLESSLNTALSKEKESKKKMNASNARALTAMKQKVKKTVKEYEKEVKDYQADPEAFERAYHAANAPAAAAPKPERRRAAAGDAEGEEQPDEDFTTVGRGGRAMQFTTEGIFKNLQMVQEARGKKNTDRQEQIRILEKLLEVAVTSYQRIRVLLVLVSSRFDYNASAATHMPAEAWVSAQKEIDQLVSIVASQPEYVVQETTEDYDELVERSPAESPDGVVRIRGSIISFVDRLDDEFTKSLQNIDPHGTEYVDRLKDEKGLYSTICRAQAYYEKTKQEDPLARVIMRRIEHIYSKPDPVVQALEAGLAASDVAPSISLVNQGSTTALVQTLCVHLYKGSNSLLRTRAMLSHIYHHALHNEFHTARDMFLMSHLQESVHSADVATQILYNRTVVQLGLCAFRCGLIREAQATLQDIFTTQRVKELLAQGVHQQRYQVMTPEQEKAERQRQLPFHMHINTELLEAAFLVSSMLVEIPLLASIDSEEQKRKAISKPFRRLLDFADRQIFTGPPESTRDHIMQASKALQDGEWEKCRDLIQSIKIWSLMPEAASVKEMLAKRIQEEGLRTYLFTYAPHYSTLSLVHLGRTFSLPVRTVTSIVSKMIWSEELSASLDQSSGAIVFHRIELSRGQQLSLSLADKINAMVEQNEKTLDNRLGGSSGWGDRGDGTKGDKRGEQAQERRGRTERSRGARGKSQSL